MKKIIYLLLSGLLSINIFGCSKPEEVDPVIETEPIEYTIDEIQEDENYNSLKDLKANLSVDDIIGRYDVIIYTVFGHPFVRGMDDWNEIFEATETFGISIIDKEHLVFDALEGEYDCSYTLEGNVIHISIDSYVDEEYEPFEGVIVDGSIIIDLDGAKLYMVNEEIVEDAIEHAYNILDYIQPDLDIKE